MLPLPPYAEMLGCRIEAQADGSPLLVLPTGNHLIGRPGFLHGGAIAGLLELAGFAAIRHELGDDATRIKPINITVDYMRGGRLIETRAAARVTRIGRRVANVEAEAWQEDRAKPIASAKLNLMLDRG